MDGAAPNPKPVDAEPKAGCWVVAAPNENVELLLVSETGLVAAAGAKENVDATGALDVAVTVLPLEPKD